MSILNSSLGEALNSVGLKIYIISKYGLKIKSRLTVERRINSLWEPKIYWREKLGCEFSYIKSVSKSSDNQIILLFTDLKLIFEVDDCVEDLSKVEY